MKSRIESFFTTKLSKEAREVRALVEVFADFFRIFSMYCLFVCTVFMNRTICWFFQANWAILSFSEITPYSFSHSISASYFNLRSTIDDFKLLFFFFCCCWVFVLCFFFKLFFFRIDDVYSVSVFKIIFS